MAPTQNKAFIYHSIPTELPKAGENISVVDRPIDLESTAAPDGGLLVRNIYASFDPYMRGRMRDPGTKSYVPAFKAGEPLTNSSISQVLKSGTSKFAVGDVVLVQQAPIEEYSVLEKAVLDGGAVSKLDNPHNIAVENFLGALGMPGLTAYSSLYEIGQPKKGETIFISSAAGPVGAIVGQLAKHEGLRVIGSVGDDAKLEYIKSIGFDDGFNYKKEKPADALKRLAPDGLDIYYENVGGEHLQAALNIMKDFGRIVASGMISQYNLKPEDTYAVKNLMLIVARRLKFQGFIVLDENMGAKYAAEHQKNVGAWIADGSFKAKNSITSGIDNAPEGLIGLFQGKNFGKALLKIADLETK